MKRPSARKQSASESESSRVPLARLLALAYRQIIDELHSRLAVRGYADVSPNFGYVLLALRDRPMTATAVASLLGVTKQAASKLVDAMDDGGYVTRGVYGGDARAKTITISAQGKRFLTTVESIYREIEDEWANMTSNVRLDALRGDLQIIVESAHEGRLPMIRPTR